MTRTAPGLVLGASVVSGTVVAALAVRPRAGRLIFPVPALFYLIAALTAGIIYDRSADSSRTALAIDATQWIANGFFAMMLATVLAIALTGVRWYLWRRDRRVPAAPGRASRPAGAPRRTEANTQEFGSRADPRGPGGWSNPGTPSRPGQRRQGPQRPRDPDQRPGPRPGSGPYNFSSGA